MKEMAALNLEVGCAEFSALLALTVLTKMSIDCRCKPLVVQLVLDVDDVDENSVVCGECAQMMHQRMLNLSKCNLSAEVLVDLLVAVDFTQKSSMSLHVMLMM